MRPIKKTIVLCCLFVLGFLTPPGTQSLEFKSEHFYVDDGLPNAKVNDILQDSQGFMWFATLHGLARYDGYHFKVFLPDHKEPHSLSHPEILALAEDTIGNLWIGTTGGLNKYDRQENKFYHFTHSTQDSTSLSSNNIQSLFCDSQGSLWIIHDNSMLDRLYCQTNHITRYRHDPHDEQSISNDFVSKWESWVPATSSIVEDRNNNVWIGTSRGLNLYNDANDTFIPASRKMLNSAILDTARISSLFYDADEMLWISTWGQGLFRYNPASNALTHFRRENKNINILPSNYCNYMLQGPQQKLWLSTKAGLCFFDASRNGFVALDVSSNSSLKGGRNLQPIYADNNNYLWTISNNTLYLIDSQSHKVLPIPDDRRFKRNIGANPLSAFYQDSFGNLWIGRMWRGVLKLNPRAQQFKLIPPFADSTQLNKPFTVSKIMNSLEDTSKLYISTSDGLYQYDHQRKNISSLGNKLFSHILDSIRGSIFPIHQDKDKSLWLGFFGDGLIHIKNDDEITRYVHDQNDTSSLSGDEVWAIHRDTSGNLWIGTTYNGLNRFDDNNNNFVRYKSGPKPHNLPGNFVQCIFEDKGAALWIGTENGLCRYDPENDIFSRYLEGMSVFTIYQDCKSRLWLGMEFHGLGRFDPQNDTVDFFGKEHGLLYPKIDAILEDEQGYLWCATEGGGLSKFDPQKGQFTTFTEQHGLPSNALHVGGAKTEDGTFFFSTLFDGIVYFHPRDIKLNTIPPKILLTDIKIDGISVPISEDTPLKQNISLTKEIHFDHWENDITIEMTALHFAYPEYNQYKYWLENYDEDWHDAGANRLAIYTNLNPGRYIFHAKGSNGDGVWSNEEAKLVIVIQPPWWRTWIAYIAYGVLLVGLIVGMIKVVKNRERQKARMRETELHAQAAEAHARAVEAEALALKAEDERKTKELEEARNLQLSMLPQKIPKLPYVDIAVYMQTATEVGGDYYDFNHSKNGVLTIAVGDATDHGMRAGNMVVSIKSLFKDLTDDQPIPEFFNRCTGILKNMNMDKVFMALTIARINNNTISLSTSGMPPAFLYKKADKSVTEILIKGMPLGAMRDFPYEEQTFSIDPGDTLLLFSDGLAELFNEQKEMFDYERISCIFAENAEQSPQAIIDALVTAATTWRGNEPQADDMTFVVVKAV